jgi:lauroyl/myristoyl acyltransferase
VIGKTWWRGFLVRGVMWRRVLRWAVLNVPICLEPAIIAFWTLLFFLWQPVGRGARANLQAIFPRSTMIGNLLRTYRLLWNFAWTITDNVRFAEMATVPDWEFVGFEHYQRLQRHEGGAIILTAHMGSYDLGAQLLATRGDRKLTIVRAPEPDPETQEFEARAHKRSTAASVRIDYNTRATDLAFQLMEALQAGEIVAIQGDRVTGAVASIPAELFGQPTLLPSGPFALAMAARVPIFPLFVIRLGRRRYRLLTCEPISVERTSRDRDADLRSGVAAWTETLEHVIREHWYQWYTFEPFYRTST